MPSDKLRQGVIGFAIGLVTHGVAFLAGFIAARLVEPSEGGGFEDIAAVAVTFLGIEILLGLASIVTGAVFFSRRRRELGLGLVLGWLAGVIAIWLALR